MPGQREKRRLITLSFLYGKHAVGANTAVSSIYRLEKGQKKQLVWLCPKLIISAHQQVESSLINTLQLVLVTSWSLVPWQVVSARLIVFLCT